jgi:uncharacterized protein
VIVPDLTIGRAAAIIAAGGAAGFINSIVGSGTLISFPTLVGVGFDKITANVTNNIGLFPGSASASWGFRHELAGHWRRVTILASASGSGAICGSLLLFRLSAEAFRVIVPFLVLIGVALVLMQPMIMRSLRSRRPEGEPTLVGPVTVPLWLAVFGAGVYGGYFGAAQGVILIGIMGILLDEPLVRINAFKNVLSTVVGFAAGLVFLTKSDVPWTAVGLLTLGSISGGLIGARVGRKISPPVLRSVVAMIGVIAATRLLLG